MPKKGAVGVRKNNQLSVSLPPGARFQIDQLVDLGSIGDSHSEVIRYLVITALETMRPKYELRLTPPGSDAKE